MAGRTFAIGDIHGDIVHLRKLLSRLPSLTAEDSLVFLGDYVDRGDASRQVVELMLLLGGYTSARVVCLRGNHEDAWLTVREKGWVEFVIPADNGCWDTLRSYVGRPARNAMPDRPDWEALTSGSFFPQEHIAWMRTLPPWYEDEHAIYVHAGLPREDGRFLHPRDANPSSLLWQRDEAFFREYQGKRVVCGHTPTERLPNELSTYALDDPTDMWFRDPVVAVDTQCGRGGYLTAIELPALRVYESR